MVINKKLIFFRIPTYQHAYILFRIFKKLFQFDG